MGPSWAICFNAEYLDIYKSRIDQQVFTFKLQVRYIKTGLTLSDVIKRFPLIPSIPDFDRNLRILIFHWTLPVIVMLWCQIEPICISCYVGPLNSGGGRHS